MKKRAIWILFTLLVLLLISISCVEVNGQEGNIPDVPSVCTMGCSCDGVHYFDCACDADFCYLCHPGDIGYEKECHNKSKTGTTQGSTPYGDAESTDNPQAPTDYIGLVGTGLANLVRTAFGQPAIVRGEVETSRPTAIEIILSIIALVALLTTAVAIISAILKPIFAKILASQAGGGAPAIMVKAQSGRPRSGVRYNNVIRNAGRYRPSRQGPRSRIRH